MFGKSEGAQEKARPSLALVGLMMMTVSFAWLQRSPPVFRPQIDVQAPAPEGPFALVVLDAGHGGQDS